MPVAEELLELRCDLFDVMAPLLDRHKAGRSKMCMVDLSEVTAKVALFGDIAIE